MTLAHLPDDRSPRNEALDDALRRLSEAIALPEACRQRICRNSGRCAGGEGPPCFWEFRAFLMRDMREGFRAYRGGRGPSGSSVRPGDGALPLAAPEDDGERKAR